MVFTTHPSAVKYFMTAEMRTQPSSGKSWDISQDLRIMARSHEYQGKGDYLTGMLSMPYLQGLALYFLTAAFPLFAFALLVPGRHHTFMLWFGLWFWVKFWDFGFAVVMVLDELLYYLMPRGPFMSETTLGDPGEAFRLLLQSDPSYSMSTQYNILATAIGAVPILCGIFIKKSAGDVVDAISNGVSSFGGRVGGSMTSNARGLMASNLLQQIEKNKVDAGSRALAQTFSDPLIQKALGMQGLNSVLENTHDPRVRKDLIRKGLSAFHNSSNSYLKDLVGAKIEYNTKLAMWEESIKPHNQKLSDTAVLVKWFSHEHALKPYGLWEKLAIAERNYQWGGSNFDSFMTRARGLFVTGAGLFIDDVANSGPIRLDDRIEDYQKQRSLKRKDDQPYSTEHK
jgi:hypothetical protein